MGLDFGLRRQLSHSDLRGLAKFLGEYCAPAPLDQFVPRAIEGLFQLVSCEGVSCGVVDPDRGEGSAVGYPSDFFSPESSKRVILIGSRELTPRFRETTGGFVAFSNLLGRAEFHRTGMYNEHFRNRDIEDVAVLPSLDSRGLGTFFSVERGRDFSDRDLALLNTVAAPLQAAFSNASRLTQLEEENGLLKSTLEAAGWNGLVVSHHARIYLESPQARKLLVSYFGCDASNDRLPDSVLRWIHASADRLRQPSTVELELSPFYVTRGGRRLVIRMLLHPAGYVLLLEEQKDRAELSGLMALGLTTRQAQILAYIAMGKTNGEIAIILSMSRRTVEKHIEQIFKRLNVETRTGAAVLALETLHTKT